MYRPIVTVNISLLTSGVTRESFGVLIFISEHAWFTERVRSYTSINAVAEDVPTSSPAYIAAQQAFGGDRKPSLIMLGRREITSVVFTPEPATSSGQTYSITVTGTDGTPITATYTTIVGDETAEDITTELGNTLAAVVGVTVVVGVTGDITIAKDGVEDFSVSGISRLTYNNVSGESAADTLNAIREENDDFYFITADDKSDSFVMDMAAAVEATEKQYFVAVEDTVNLAPYTPSASDTLSKLAQNGYDRTSGYYHHGSETNFIELQYVIVGSTYEPGKVAWGNRPVTGGAARNADTGKLLSATEKGNLSDKNANYADTRHGNRDLSGTLRMGSVASGKWIDEVRERDFLVARTREALIDLLVNTPKLPFTDTGILKVRNTLENTYDPYIESDAQVNILDQRNPYEIRLPRRSDVDFSTITTRTLAGEVTLYLTGAILIININGVATYNTDTI